MRRIYGFMRINAKRRDFVLGTICSVANSITAVQILKTKAVIVQVFDHFSPKYAVIVRVLSD
jgi:hypothetical protein